METVLITGIAGFIGSHLARAALEQGFQVRGLDNFSSGCRASLSTLGSRVTTFDADLTDDGSLQRACEGVDYIFHHAAIASMSSDMDVVDRTQAANITGTLRVLMAARKAGVKRIVFASSASVYGNQRSVPIGEVVPPGPVSFYALSKRIGEQYMNHFDTSYGLETICLRYFNVYGPGQRFGSEDSGFIARVINQMLCGKSVTIFGDGEQTRDFIYIDDVVHVTLAAMRSTAGRLNECIFNIGSGRAVTLNHVYSTLQTLTGSSGSRVYAPARSCDIVHSTADIRLATDLLSFRPQVELVEGLAHTVEWQRAPSRPW